MEFELHYKGLPIFLLQLKAWIMPQCLTRLASVLLGLRSVKAFYKYELADALA